MHDHVNKLRQNVGLETWKWRQIVTSQTANTKYKWPPYDPEPKTPHENFLRMPLFLPLKFFVKRALPFYEMQANTRSEYNYCEMPANSNALRAWAWSSSKSMITFLHIEADHKIWHTTLSALLCDVGVGKTNIMLSYRVDNQQWTNLQCRREAVLPLLVFSRDLFFSVVSGVLGFLLKMFFLILVKFGNVCCITVFSIQE